MDRGSDKKQTSTVQALADKLQRGWAMLAQMCPVCNTPLVREKGTQRIYCVQCQLFVVREQDLTEEQKQQQMQQQATSRNATPASSPIKSPPPTAVKPQQPAAAAASQQPQREKSLEELEAGLASLSSHRMYGQFREELRAENGDANEEKEHEDADEFDRAPPNKTKTQAARNLEEYARSKALERAEAEAEEYAAYSSQSMTPAQVDAHMSRVDQLSARLGEKMLQGWTLLGDACPDDACQCPLMRARGETKEMVCVNCGSTIVKEGDILRIVKFGGNKPAAASTSAATATSKPTATTTSSTSKPATKRPVFRQTRRQRLDEDEEDDEEDDEDLAHYGEAEDVVPSPTSTAAHGKQQQQQASFDIVDPYRLPADLPDDFSDLMSSTSFLARPSSDDPSAKLGEKMLQGYALLSVHCPRDGCNCPLVRKKDGPMLCVKCGSTVVDANEYDEQVHGKAENMPSNTTVTLQPTSQQAQRQVTPVKRLASPGLNDLRETQLSEKKSKLPSPKPASNVRSPPTFPSGVMSTSSPVVHAMSPLVRAASFDRSATAESGADSGASSELPSPSNGMRSRTLSMDEETVDPRLRQLARLGGQRGRFNPPHSRAPSLAVGPTLPGALSQRYTSSAALNAAAQMAFGGASTIGQKSREHRSSSAASSGEASPRHHPMSTPPVTPAIVPSFSLALTQPAVGGVPSVTSRAGMSRHPSFAIPRGSIIQPQQQAASPAFTGQQPTLQQVTFAPSGSIPEFSISASHASVDTGVDSVASVVSLTASTLALKLEECRARVAELDAVTGGVELRDLFATMRDLLLTLQCLQQLDLQASV